MSAVKWQQCYLGLSMLNIKWKENPQKVGSDNGLLRGRPQAITWTNAGILLIRTIGINISEILRETHTFSLKKSAFENVIWEIAATYLGLNVLTMHTLSVFVCQLKTYYFSNGCQSMWWS